MTTPRLIEVSEQHEGEVPASAGTLRLVVAGSKLFTGAAALKKSAEVGQLVAGLVGAGLAEDDVRLIGVEVEVTSGLLGKSSSATYEIAARCRDLALLPSALEVVTHQKTCRMTEIEWEYESTHERRREWLALCAVRAKAKAEAIAAALGVALGPLHAFTEGGVPAEAPRTALFEGMGPMRASRARADVAANLATTALAPAMKVVVRATVAFETR